MLTQKKQFTRSSKLQQDYINLSARKQKNAQAKYEDMELDGYKNDVYSDPLNRPNIQYSDPSMQFNNNNMINNMPQMNVTHIPTVETNITSLSLNNLLADLLDFIDSYEGDNDTLYNKIINTLNAVEQSIKNTLNVNRNAYPDIVSALQVFNERLQQTKGYHFMKNIIDGRLIMIKRLIETYQKNIVKSKSELEAENKVAKEQDKDAVEFETLLIKLEKDKKTTHIGPMALKRFIQLYQKNPDLVNKDTDTKNRLRIAITQNVDLIKKEKLNGTYVDLIGNLKTLFESNPANTEDIVEEKKKPVHYVLDDQLKLKLDSSKMKIDKFIDDGMSDREVTEYFIQVSNELLPKSSYWNNPLNVNSIRVWADSFTGIDEYPQLDIVATEFVEINVNKHTPYTSRRLADLTEKRANLARNRMIKHYNDGRERENFEDKIMQLRKNKHEDKEATEWEKILHMALHDRNVIKLKATMPANSNNDPLNSTVDNAARFLRGVTPARFLKGLKKTFKNDDNDDNDKEGSGIFGSGLIDNDEIRILGAEILRFMTTHFNIKDYAMVQLLDDHIVQKLFDFATEINNKHNLIGLPNNGNNGNININVNSPGHMIEGNNNGNLISAANHGPGNAIYNIVMSKLGSYAMITAIVLLFTNNVYQYGYGYFSAMGTEKQIESLEKTNVQLIDELTKLSQKFENEKVMLEQHLNECRNMITNSKVTFSDREKELIDTIVSLTEQCNIAVDAHITEIKNMDINNMEREEFVSTWNDVFDETLKQFMQWKYIIAAICTGLSLLLVAGNIFYSAHVPLEYGFAHVVPDEEQDNDTLRIHHKAAARQGRPPRLNKSSSPVPTNPHSVQRSNSVKPSKSRARSETMLESSAEGIYGGNVLDQQGPTAALTNMLNKYGNMSISGIAVFRHTIPGALNYVAKKLLPYDDLYHLGLFFKVHTGTGEKLLKLDKESYIMLREMDSIPNTETVIQLHLVHATLNQIFEKMKIVFPGHLWRYNAISNNCQIFVMMVLSVLNLVTPQIKEFILQDKIQNYKNPYVEKFMQSVTRLHGFVNGNILGGNAVENELFGNQSNRSMNMVENYMLNEQRIKK